MKILVQCWWDTGPLRDVVALAGWLGHCYARLVSLAICHRVGEVCSSLVTLDGKQQTPSAAEQVALLRGRPLVMMN